MDSVTENLHTLVKASMERGRLVEANYALDAIAEIERLRAAPARAVVGAENERDKLRSAAVKVLTACNRPHDLDLALDDLERVVRATPLPRPSANVGAQVGAGEDPLGDEY